MSSATASKAGPAKAKFFIPGLPYPLRVVLITAMIIGGFAAQFLFQWLIPGVVLIAVGSLLGSVRSVKTEPKTLHGASEWKEVLPQQWKDAAELSRKAKRWQSDITNLLSPFGIILAMAVAGCALFIFGFSIDFDAELSLVFIADLLALFGPLMLIGMLKAWEPPLLQVKLKALNYVLDYLETETHPDILVQPMMEVTEGGAEGGGGIPLDARMMIRFKEAPENFYGVQVQVSANEVQGTHYPYLYAVVLYKQDFPADYDSVGVPRHRWLVFEPSREDEVVVLVLRQKTSKSSGYHTKEPRQCEIVDAALGLAREILQAGTVA